MCRPCYLRWWHSDHPGRRAEYQRRWRERHGESYNARRRKPLEPRTCPVCGTGFIPATANQVYCPPTDARSGAAEEPATVPVCEARGQRQVSGWVSAAEGLRVSAL